MRIRAALVRSALATLAVASCAVLLGVRPAAAQQPAGNGTPPGPRGQVSQPLPGGASGWGEDPIEQELLSNTSDRAIPNRVRRRRSTRRRRPRTLPTTDQRIYTGGTFTGIGVVGFIIGGVVFGSGVSGNALCGVDGCVNRPHHVQRLAGESMMVGSAVMTAASLPVLLSGLLADDRQIIHSEGQMRAGTSLTLLGSGLFASGLAALTLEQRERQGTSGFSTASFGDRFFGNRERTDASFLGGITLGLGAVLTAVGVPLWLNGGRTHRNPISRAPRVGLTTPVPEIGVGAGSAQLTWRWQ